MFRVVLTGIIIVLLVLNELILLVLVCIILNATYILSFCRSPIE